MKIRIYQINLERDEMHNAFMGGNDIELIDDESYDLVFAGEVPCKTLEEVFQMFNSEKIPADYAGRSLNVSDIVAVEIDGADDIYYFCDSVGWSIADFDPKKAKDGRKKKHEID